MSELGKFDNFTDWLDFRFNHGSVNQIPVSKKLSWLQKIRGYDDLQARCQSGESMRDHYKELYDECSRSIAKQMHVLVEKSRELSLALKVSDVWQEKLINLQKENMMIGKRLKWKSGNIDFEVIVGNPITLLITKFPPKDKEKDEGIEWIDYSICKHGDTFRWYKGVKQVLKNFFDDYIGDPDIELIIKRDLYAKYPELK